MHFKKHKEYGRKAEISLKFSEFEMPPMQDILIVGKKAPIGPGAVRRMVDAISPEQYEVIPVENEVIEALVIKKSVLKFVPLEKLKELIIDESLKISDEKSVIKAQIDIVVASKKVIDL